MSHTDSQFLYTGTETLKRSTHRPGIIMLSRFIAGCRRGWYGKNCKHRCYCPKHHTCSRTTGECHCRHRRCMIAANPSIRGNTGRGGVPHVHVQGETGMYYKSKYSSLEDKQDVLIVKESYDCETVLYHNMI